LVRVVVTDNISIAPRLGKYNDPQRARRLALFQPLISLSCCIHSWVAKSSGRGRKPGNQTW